MVNNDLFESSDDEVEQEEERKEQTSALARHLARTKQEDPRVSIDGSESFTAVVPVLLHSFYPDNSLNEYEQLINKIFRGADRFYRFTIQTWYYTVLKCVVCQQEFREIGNLGRLQCRQHMGHLLLQQPDTYRWSCCSQSTADSLGCVRADHTIRQTIYTNKDHISVPVTIGQGLKTLYPDTHYLSKTKESANVMVVPRFDVVAAEDLWLNRVRD